MSGVGTPKWKARLIGAVTFSEGLPIQRVMIHYYTFTVGWLPSGYPHYRYPHYGQISRASVGVRALHQTGKL